MAEEQVMARALVLDNIQDKLARKIKNRELELRNDLLNIKMRYFFSVFAHLCERYFKLNKSDLLEIVDNNEEFMALELEVFKKAERSYKFHKYVLAPCFVCIPIFGWCMIVEYLWPNFRYYNAHYVSSEAATCHYCILRGILIEKEGENSFYLKITALIKEMEEIR